MKKLIAITLAVVLVISLIAAIPVLAKTQPHNCRAVFESDIVALELDGQELDKGEVWIREDGSYKVEIEGAELVEGDEYTVRLRYNLVTVVELGTIEINEDGEGMIEGWLSDVAVEDEVVKLPWVVILDDEDFPQFGSGFYAPLD